jgi:hypothetical protein
MAANSVGGAKGLIDYFDHHSARFSVSLHNYSILFLLLLIISLRLWPNLQFKCILKGIDPIEVQLQLDEVDESKLPPLVDASTEWEEVVETGMPPLEPLNN